MRYVTGVLLMLVGFALIFVYVPRYAIENLPQTFIDVWGPSTLLPPQYWSTAIGAFGIFLATLGVFVLIPWGQLLKDEK